jgi:hypothetical protein
VSQRRKTSTTPTTLPAVLIIGAAVSLPVVSIPSRATTILGQRCSLNVVPAVSPYEGHSAMHAVHTPGRTALRFDNGHYRQPFSARPGTSQLRCGFRAKAKTIPG